MTIKNSLELFSKQKIRVSSIEVANNYIGKYVTYCARLVENW